MTAAKMKRFLEEAKKMIRINSESTNGNEEISNFVSVLMQDRGLKTQLQQVTHSQEGVSKRQFNVVGILGDPLVDRKIRKGLLLNTHLDTVSPGILTNWTETNHDPFDATIKDGKIYGLGTADVKLDFLCKLYAIQKFREKKLKEPVYLVGTCGEEIGMFGAKYLIKSFMLNPRYVLVGEPSDLKVVYAHKRRSLYRSSIRFQMIQKDARGFNRKVRIQCAGKSAHGAYPEMGSNAILGLSHFLKSAVEEGFEMRFAHLEGGDSINKVPDRSKVELFLTSHQFEDFKRFFREKTSQISSQENLSYEIEFGGVGDTGVWFFPESFLPCFFEILDVYEEIRNGFSKVNDSSYSPAHSTCNLGRIQLVMGGLEIYHDMRVLPQIPFAEIEEQVKKGVEKVRKNYPNLNVDCVEDRGNPGLNMQLEDPLVQLCKESMSEVGIDPVLDKKATSTEASQYFKAGYPAVIFGPGKSQGNSHSPNEYNILEHFEKAIEFYERMIEKVCL